MTPDELKKWREDHHVSQSELAELLGVDAMTVSRWERGARGIPPFLHLALAALAARHRQRKNPLDRT